MDEVVVTALRYGPRVSSSPSRVTVLSEEAIQLSGASSLAGLLLMVPGIFVKDYGGSSGLKTVGQRGLGAEHTLILLNGLRISSFQNGLADLGLIAAETVSGIEVLHGGHSAAHGSEAMGGVVNIRTQPQREPHALQVKSSFGSFGYQKIGAQGGLRWAGGEVRLGLAEERSREDFPFIFRNGENVDTLRRTNADLKSSTGTVQAFLDLGTRTRLTSLARVYVSERGVPGPVLSPASSSEARQDDADHLAQCMIESDISPEVTATVSGQVHYFYQRYQDPELNIGQSEGLDTWFRNVDLRISPAIGWVPDGDLKLQFGGEAAKTIGYGTSLKDDVIRWQGSGFFVADFKPADARGIIPSISLIPSLRFDSFTSSTPSWSSHVGLVAAFEQLSGDHFVPTFRASVGRNFRVPTFNELYYNGGGGLGNPNLRPEHSTTWEVGAGVSAESFGHQQVQLSWFMSDMTDRIVWVSSGGIGVTPRNIHQVISQGIEATWQWVLSGENIRVKGDYAYVSSTIASNKDDPVRAVGNQLVYVPLHTARVDMSWLFPVEIAGLSTIGGSIAWQFVGMRYTTPDNVGYLPSYSLLNAGLKINAAAGPLAVNTGVDVDNILNEEYQVILGYPMQQRSVRVTVGLGF
jgi:outer membrane cobalamin receptor